MLRLTVTFLQQRAPIRDDIATQEDEAVVKGGISYGSDGYRRPGAGGLDLAGLGWRNAQARLASLRQDVREFGRPEGTGDSDEQARQPVRNRKRPGFMLYERGKGR